MKPIQTVALCVRLFAVWMFWLGMSGMSRTYFAAHEQFPDISILPYFAATILLVPVCLLLWFFPKTLARAVLPKDPEGESYPPVFDDWFAVGSSLVGLWVLASALPGLVGVVVGDLLSRQILGNLYIMKQSWPSYLLIYGGQLVFGAWLFFGAKGARRLLRWAREV